MKKFVREFMTRDLTAVTEDMTLQDVAELLSIRRLYGVPVVNQYNQVIGFISEKTLVRSVFPERVDTDNMMITLNKFAQIIKRIGNIGESKVKTFMRSDPIVVKEETLIADVVEIILNKDINSLPVCRDGVLVGVITRANICRFLIDSDRL